MANALVLTVGQNSILTPEPLVPGGGASSKGVISNLIFTFNDPSASVEGRPDGVSALVTGLLPSENGPVTGTASFTIKDTNGAISNWIQAFTIEVDAPEATPAPLQLTESVAINFSTPE